MNRTICMVIIAIALLSSNLYAAHLTCDLPAEYENYNITSYAVYEGDLRYEDKLDPDYGMWHDLSDWECGCHTIRAAWLNQYGESDLSDELTFCLECDEEEVIGVEILPPEEPVAISEAAVEPEQEFIVEDEPETIVITEDDVDQVKEEAPVVYHDNGGSGGGCFISTVFGGGRNAR
jgi:hypothetical protein